MKRSELEKDVTSARENWINASSRAAQMAEDMYQPGSGYGDPQAEIQDRYRVETAKNEAHRLMLEYHDLDRRLMDIKINQLQKSQTIATWASFTVAFVVGLATVVSTVLQLAD
ncbi:hypothetical protein K6U43_00565 [Vibrio parahaemolyticus]|nr:hypothetical protein [Vibrio parahaemolyticus]